MDIKTASLDSFEEYHELSGRLQGQKNQQDKKGIEVMRINSLLRYSNRTPETRAAFNRVVSEKETIDQDIADLETRLATIRTVRSAEICRGLQEEYTGIVHRLASAVDDFYAVLQEERIFRELLQEKGIEVTWPPHPLQALDPVTLKSFREWILETLPEISEKKETANQTKKRGKSEW